MQVKKDSPPTRVQQDIWEQVYANTAPHHDSEKSISLLTNKYWLAASVFFLAAGLSIYFLFFLSNQVSYQTAYGETKTILLPDSSVITLNANSTIHYTTDWEEQKVREIWLEGEAFFEVKQIPIADDSSGMRLPFVVHSHNMDVEVLGTTFNVKDRESYSEVVLNTGKVSVTPKQSQEVAPIAMLPGDWLAYSTDRQEWKIQHINPEIYTSWRNQELIFDEMKLKEIAQILEETYGYSISIEQAEVANYEFTGKIRSDEIELLLPMLERSFGLKIEQSGNDINFFKR
jgi:ferric-dicitrate binding protein FerR (iron transport regulator)